MKLIIISMLSISLLTLSPVVFSATFNVKTTTEFRQALKTSATNNENDTIVLADGIYRTDDDNGGTFIYLSNEEFSLTLSGSSSDNVIIDGGGKEGVISFRSTFTASNVYINNIAVANGISSSDIGAAITTNQRLHINNSNIRDNKSQNKSAAIFTSNALYLTNSTFLQNSKIDFSESNTYSLITGSNNPVSIKGSHFEGNQGSMINMEGGYVKESTFINNIIETIGVSGEPYSAPSRIIISDYGVQIDSVNIINPEELIYNASECIKLGNAYSVQTHTITNSVLVNCGFSSYGKTTHTTNSLFKGDTFRVTSLNTVYNSIFIESRIVNYEGILNFQNSYIDTLTSTYNPQDIITENMLSSDAELGFINIEKNDFRLTSSSALIDSGVSDIESFTLPEKDYAMNYRISGGSIDIGPYEYPSTTPTISSFSFIGDTQEQSELVFSAEYDLADGRNLQTIEYDFGNGFVTEDNFTFNTSGVYSVTVKVTDNTGEFSTSALDVTISELPWSEMTFEQRLVKAVPTEYYEDIQQGISLERSEASVSARLYVQDNPSEFSLVSVEALASSESTINELTLGWSLISTSSAITELTMFSDVKVIWIYVDGAWQGWSSDQTILQQIELDENYNVITSIPNNSGIWVLK